MGQSSPLYIQSRPVIMKGTARGSRSRDQAGTLMFRWPEVNGGDADVPRRRDTRSLFALESHHQTRLDDRRELSRPDHSSVTAEVDGFAVGRVEGLVPARVPPGLYPHGVMP